MTGPEFKAARKRLGLTLDAVAKRYGVSFATIAHFEREWVSAPRWDVRDASEWLRNQMRARTIKGRP